MDKDTVAIYSGGMDSFTLVNRLHREGRLHSALSFYYGQRHGKELDFARKVCDELDIKHTLLDLSALTGCLRGSSLTEPTMAVPEGHYEAENMKLTVVPNRNAIMLSIAVAHAVSQKLHYVACGVHAGDHTIYPDCRPEFIAAMSEAAAKGNWNPIHIRAPYLYMTKVGILEEGFMMDLDYSKSWTCYKGLTKPCGVCGSCQERLEAFKAHDRRDPLEYMTHE